MNYSILEVTGAANFVMRFLVTSTMSKKEEPFELHDTESSRREVTKRVDSERLKIEEDAVFGN